jgi:F0F1-type ATP synthase beta subunit
LYPTAIKVIDFFCPFTYGGRAAVFGGAGVNKTVVLMEFIYNAVERLQGVTVFAGIGERSREGLELWEEIRRRGVLAQTAMVFGQMKKPPGARCLVGLAALTVAEYSRDTLAMDPDIVGARHYQAVQEARCVLGRYEELRDIIAMPGLDELAPEDRQLVGRAHRLQNFFTQPFFVTESFTGQPGRSIPIEETVAGVEPILDGQYDDVPENHTAVSPYWRRWRLSDWMS